MAGAHTPGPWKIGYRTNHTPIYGANNEHVAWMDGSAYANGTNKLTEQGEANARLIAEAPMTTAALRAFVEFTAYVVAKRGSCVTSQHLVLANADEMLTGARALLARIDGGE